MGFRQASSVDAMLLSAILLTSLGLGFQDGGAGPLDALKAGFNQDRAKPRILTVLSPT